MPVTPDEGSFFAPKWFVIGFALVALALIIQYDLRLGLAAGAVLGVVAAPWLYLTLRFSLVGADRPTERRAMLDRFRQQFSNRRKAAADKDNDKDRDRGSGA